MACRQCWSETERCKSKSPLWVASLKRTEESPCRAGAVGAEGPCGSKTKSAPRSQKLVGITSISENAMPSLLRSNMFLTQVSTPLSEIIVCVKAGFEEFLSRDCAKFLQPIARNNSWRFLPMGLLGFHFATLLGAIHL